MEKRYLRVQKPGPTPYTAPKACPGDSGGGNHVRVQADGSGRSGGSGYDNVGGDCFGLRNEGADMYGHDPPCDNQQR